MRCCDDDNRAILNETDFLHFFSFDSFSFSWPVFRSSAPKSLTSFISREQNKRKKSNSVRILGLRGDGVKLSHWWNSFLDLNFKQCYRNSIEFEIANFFVGH